MSSVSFSKSQNQLPQLSSLEKKEGKIPTPIESFWDRRSTRMVVGSVILVAVAAITISCLLFIPGAPLAFAGAGIAGFLATKLGISFAAGAALCVAGFTALPPMLAAGVGMLVDSKKNENLLEIELINDYENKTIEDLIDYFVRDLIGCSVINIDGQEFHMPFEKLENMEMPKQNEVAKEIAEQLIETLTQKIPDEKQRMRTIAHARQVLHTQAHEQITTSLGNKKEYKSNGLRCVDIPDSIVINANGNLKRQEVARIYIRTDNKPVIFGESKQFIALQPNAIKDEWKVTDSFTIKFAYYVDNESFVMEKPAKIPFVKTVDAATVANMSIDFNNNI